MSVQHNRKTGGQRGDKSQRQCSTQDIQGNAVEGKTARMEVREKLQEPVVLFGHDVPTQGNRVERKSFNTFLFLDAQRQRGNTAGRLRVMRD